jgi:hypothetical protein
VLFQRTKSEVVRQRARRTLQATESGSSQRNGNEILVGSYNRLTVGGARPGATDDLRSGDKLPNVPLGVLCRVE